MLISKTHFFPFILRKFHIKTTIISYDEDTVSLGRIVDTYYMALATVQTIAIIINLDFEVSDKEHTSICL